MTPPPLFLSNVDTATWIRSASRLLLIRGWLFEKSGLDILSVRARWGDGETIGCYGLARPDVSRAFDNAPQGKFSGFSCLIAFRQTPTQLALEAADSEGFWHPVTEIHIPSVSSVLNDVVVAEAELKGAEYIHSDDACLDDETTPKAPRPVLFISHDYVCAGAQLLLLRQLRWLRAQAGMSFEILMGVPRCSIVSAQESELQLLAHFQTLGPVHFLSDVTGAPENLALIRQERYALIYANTATLGWLLPALRPHVCPVVSHVHELAFWIEKRTGVDIFQRQAAVSAYFIACSGAVRDYLVQKAGVIPEKIETIHACGSTAQAAEISRTYTSATIRQELAIPEDAFVVMACGTFDWRKGSDLFVPICIALRRKLAGREFRAFWIGDPGSQMNRDQFDHEVKTAGLAGKIALLGHRRDPLRLMLAADCFALPSREDPFPLVMLEAATLGLPIVGFRDSGGVVEFVGEEAGLLAPFMDIDAFAGALSQLAHDPAQAQRQGRAGRERAAGLFDEERSFQRVLVLINKFTGSAWGKAC